MDRELLAVWEAVLNRLKNTIVPHQFEAWIVPIVPLSVSGAGDGLEFHIQSKNQFAAEWVKDHYKTEIESAVAAEVGRPIRLSVNALNEDLQPIGMIVEQGSKKGVSPTLKTGFPEFDNITGGLESGKLIVLGGRPSMGKTSFAMSIVANLSREPSNVIAIFSIEMSKEETGFAILSHISGINRKTIKEGSVENHEWGALTGASKRLSESKVFIDDNASYDFEQIASKSRNLFASEKHVDLIVVDYLQLIQLDRNSIGSRESEISDAMRGFKQLAIELQCSIVVLSQINRGVESRPNKRPLLMDLRESAMIEAHADIVVFIYRDEVYDENSELKGIAEFNIAKNRTGECGTVRIRYSQECGSILSFSMEAQP